LCQGIMMKLYKVMAAMLVLVAGCAGRNDATPPKPNPVEDAAVAKQCEALINAPLDTTDTSAVGFCAAPLTTGPGGELTCAFACSATLIAKNLVLTARHCVQGGIGPGLFKGTFSAPVNSPAGLNVTLNSSGAVGNPSWYSVNQVLVPSSTDAPNDIALVILNDTMGDAAPAGVDLRTNLAAPNHPTEFTIIGRGSVHYDYDLDAGQPINVDAGDVQRRILQHIPFVCASDSTSTPCVSFSRLAPPPTNTYTLPLEYFSMGPASMGGDSGAGIFSQRSYESCLPPQVVAVASAITTRVDGQPASTLGVRVSRFADFLRAGAETAAQFGHYEKPHWADN
jgi:hypothetical protein